jgi:exodeoxyribonuclease V gamma subunit
MTGEDPVASARAKWSPKSYDGESSEPAHVRVWGERAPLEKLLAALPDDDRVPGEDTRFGALAVRLWGPLLRSEGPPL